MRTTKQGASRRLLTPFILTAVIVLVDQISKALVVHFVPEDHIGAYLFGDNLRIIHVRNHGIAFSMGVGLPAELRSLFFAILPIIIVVLLVIYYFRTNELSRLQRWAIAGIVGGGIGNLIDRVVRPDGVVDFIDAKFFGIFGLDRWPTFNLADSSVVVCGILLIIAFFVDEGRKRE